MTPHTKALQRQKLPVGIICVMIIILKSNDNNDPTKKISAEPAPVANLSETELVSTSGTLVNTNTNTNTNTKTKANVNTNLRCDLRRQASC